MADLRIENPKTTEEFVALLASAGVKLPLRLHDEDLGVVVDARGHNVLVVDENHARSDDQAEAIAQWIVLAVNTCGGFRAVTAEGAANG